MDTRRVLRPTVAGRTIPAPVVSAARAGFRRYGALTARSRPYPDFLIAGAKRCGTTSLYFHLLQHPQLLPMFPSSRYLPKARDGKGPHFFDNHYERGAAWYAGHFPTARYRRAIERATGLPTLVGEASPYSLYHPLAADRAHDLIPSLKVIIILRDPVQRTHSHYREQCRNGVETLSFEAALEAEASRTAGAERRLIESPGSISFAHEQQSYVAQSEYVHGVRRWLSRFPRESVKIVCSEDYYRDPHAVCADIFDFLAIPPPLATEAAVLNAAPKADIDPALQVRLVDHFAPYNQQLFELTDQVMDWSGPATPPTR